MNARYHLVSRSHWSNIECPVLPRWVRSQLLPLADNKKAAPNLACATYNDRARSKAGFRLDGTFDQLESFYARNYGDGLRILTKDTF